MIAVFDIGGVVCQFLPERRLAALSDLTGADRAVIEDAIWSSGLDAAAEAGLVSEEEILDVLDNLARAKVPRNEVLTAWARAFAPDPTVLSLLRGLGLARYGFTNNGPIFARCLELDLATVAEPFEAVICSYELGARKPSALAFWRLLERVGCTPGEMVFVDDSVANCRAAERVGIRSVHFTGPESISDLTL